MMKENLITELGQKIRANHKTMFEKNFTIEDKVYRIHCKGAGFRDIHLAVLDENGIEVFLIKCSFNLYEKDCIMFELHRFYRTSKEPLGIGTYMIQYLIEFANSNHFDVFKIFASASTEHIHHPMSQAALVSFYKKQDYKDMKLLLNH